MTVKKKLITFPVDLLKEVEKFHKKHYSHLGQSEFIWECISLAYAVKEEWKDEDGTYDPLTTPIGQKVILYQKAVSDNRRDGAGKRAEASSVVKKLRQVLKKADKPMGLTPLARQADVSVKTLSKTLEKYEEKYWVVYRPEKPGQALQIALIGSPVEEQVRELIDKQERMKRKKKRRKKRKPKKS